MNSLPQLVSKGFTLYLLSVPTGFMWVPGARNSPSGTPDPNHRPQNFSLCGGVDTLGRLHGHSVSASPRVRTTYAEFESRARKSGGSSQVGALKLARPARTCPSSNHRLQTSAPVRLITPTSPNLIPGEVHVTQPFSSAGRFPRNQNSLYRLRDVGMRSPFREPVAARRSAHCQIPRLSEVCGRGGISSASQKALDFGLAQKCVPVRTASFQESRVNV
jgi:hypothetical protein